MGSRRSDYHSTPVPKAGSDKSQQSYHRAFLQGALLLLAAGLGYSFFRFSPLEAGTFSWRAALAATVLVGTAELFPMELPVADHVMPFTLAVDVAVLVLYGPYTALVGYTLGITAAAVWKSSTLYDIIHHTAENAPPLLFGGLVLWTLAPPGTAVTWNTYLFAGFLAVLVRVTADLGLAVLHAWLSSRDLEVSPLEVVLGGYAFVPLLVLAPLGLVGAFLWRTQPLLVVLLVGPLVGQVVSIRRHEELHDSVVEYRQDIKTLRQELEVRTTELNDAVAELQRRLGQSFSLQAVGAAITQELDLERVLSVIARQSARIAGGDGAFITLLSEDESRQFLRAASGPHLSEYVGRELKMEGRLTGEVMRTGKPFIINDAQDDERIDQEIANQANIRAVVEAPLKVKDRILGVLGVVVHNGKRFDQEDMRLLTVLANQAAIAIENARLHERQTELAVFQERNRLARELHDSVTQSLFSIGLYLQASVQHIPDNPDQALSLLNKTQEIAQEAQAEMRSLIFELRPAAIRDKGLGFAMENLVSLVRRRHDMQVDLQREGERDLPADVELALYRVTQEALNNVTRHAEATTVTIELSLTDRKARLRIQDNGKGFDVANTQESSELSFGLTSMRERVTAVGGQLHIESELGEGTEVRASIPLAD